MDEFVRYGGRNWTTFDDVFRHLSTTKFQEQCNFSGKMYPAPDSSEKSNQSLYPSYVLSVCRQKTCFFFLWGERADLCQVGDLTHLVIHILIQVQFPFEGLSDVHILSLCVTHYSWTFFPSILYALLTTCNFRCMIQWQLKFGHRVGNIPLFNWRRSALKHIHSSL